MRTPPRLTPQRRVSEGREAFNRPIEQGDVANTAIKHTMNDLLTGDPGA